MHKLLPFLFLVVTGFSQKKESIVTATKLPDSVYSDCFKARTIKLSGYNKIGPTLAPLSEGINSEISKKKQGSAFTFEKEHHTAWYKLLIGRSGHLCFDIIPVNLKDDYDFMLFKAGRNFCDSLQAYAVKPVRACISRDKKSLSGKTGLSYRSQNEVVKEGVGDAYVKPLDVKVGEVYYLVLDNVYKNGEGHTIIFQFEEPIEIKGILKDENNHPVKAEVTITNFKGDTIASGNSRDDGIYKLKTQLNPALKYSLNFYNDSSFIYSRSLTYSDSLGYSPLVTILPKLKKGKKYTVGAINFYGGLATYLPESFPCMRNLLKLMNKNNALEIMIVGHVNGCFSFDNDPQKLSEQRAEAIRKYLIQNKINSNRIKIKGKGCKEMLYPDTKKEWEAEQNRRVEVMVLNY